MITFLTGVPGSGKTYKAVDSIYNNFSNSKNAKPDLKKEYENCYTNINELKYDKLHDSYPLDLDDLKSKLTILHKLYKEKSIDEVLIEKCKELDIYRSLFVIDEAHNIFDNNDKVLIWWLSYHRHLYHDIFLITQNLSLIYTKYKSFSEFFYKAKPTTVSLNRKTFKYDVYINSRMSMNAKSHTEKISKNDEVFELYHSGDSVKVSNILVKFYIFSFAALILAGVLFYYLLGSSDEVKKNSTPIPKVHIENKKNNIPLEEVFEDIEFDNKKLFILTCSYSKCSNESISIPPQLLRIFIKSNQIKELYSQYVNSNSTIFYLDSSKEFYTYLISKRSDTNEKFTNSDVSSLDTNLFSTGK